MDAPEALSASAVQQARRPTVEEVLPFARLIGLEVSVFSERARFAFDFYGIPFLKEEYIPLVGERALRRLLSKADGSAQPEKRSVPVLVLSARKSKSSTAASSAQVPIEEPVVADSLRISQRVQQMALQVDPEAPRLFPVDPAAADELLGWVREAEFATTHARFIMCGKALQSPWGLAESVPLPSWTPSLVRLMCFPVGYLGYWFVMRKYTHSPEFTSPENSAAVIRALLGRVRARLGSAPPAGGPAASSGEWKRDFLVGDSLSYADICIVSLMEFVEPVDEQFWPLPGPVTRSWFQTEGLRHEFPDLVKWRDTLYRKFRKREWLRDAEKPRSAM